MKAPAVILPDHRTVHRPNVNADVRKREELIKCENLRTEIGRSENEFLFAGVLYGLSHSA